MRKKQLSDAYRFPGFIPGKVVTGVFGDPYARVILLRRRQKKASALSVARQAVLSMIVQHAVFETYLAVTTESTSSSRCAAFFAAGAVL